ncbi:alpha-amylase family glycosyl hydrolase [Micromonospora schwarzwaldensis]|uniref:alpha-amylase family glycosyl hydrolase n=1 Tax=Micromonospora sp. DSM 45708 TaxID=3111767 RepID=UPI0031D2410A
MTPDPTALPDDTVARLRLDPDPGRGYHPSPVDWRDEVGYSILLDRFAHARFRLVAGDPAGGDTRHGGNLPGVTARLDYLRDLGVTVLQLSPVALTEPAAYHGYAPLHLTRVDPHLGTLDDLVELVDQAHRRGMRVLLDLVLNHTARVFDYPDGDDFKPDPAPTVRWTRTVGPREFAAAERFTRRGNIRDWKHPEQAVRGDFPPGYRRLASEDPETAELLTTVARWWVRVTDIDGIRVDAIRHMDPAFVAVFSARLKRYADRLGKHNFLILGEHSSSEDASLAECLRSGVDTVYNYPEYRRQSWALHGRAPTTDLRRSFDLARSALGERAHDRTVRFIDNHDVFRFLRDGEPEGRLHVAQAFLLFSTGMPMLYYGTEQGFRQPTGRLERECSADRASPHNREDMFGDGAFVSPSSAGDRFDTTSTCFRWTRRLVDVRRDHPALRRGRQAHRFADPDGPGLYVFSRYTDTDEVLVVLNTDDRPRRHTVPAGPLLAAQPALVDALDPGHRVDVGVAGVPVDVPGHGVRVLVAPDAAAVDVP